MGGRGGGWMIGIEETKGQRQQRLQTGGAKWWCSDVGQGASRRTPCGTQVATWAWSGGTDLKSQHDTVSTAAHRSPSRCSMFRPGSPHTVISSNRHYIILPLLNMAITPYCRYPILSLRHIAIMPHYHALATLLSPPGWLGLPGRGGEGGAAGRRRADRRAACRTSWWLK